MVRSVRQLILVCTKKKIAVYICWFCPVDAAPAVVGGVQGGHGNATFLLGAAPALRRTAPEG